MVFPRKSLDFYPMSMVLTGRVYSLVPVQVTEPSVLLLNSASCFRYDCVENVRHVSRRQWWRETDQDLAETEEEEELSTITIISIIIMSTTNTMGLTRLLLLASLGKHAKWFTFSFQQLYLCLRRISLLPGCVASYGSDEIISCFVSSLHKAFARLTLMVVSPAITISFPPT